MERAKIIAGIIFIFLAGFVQAEIQAQTLIFETKPDSVPGHPNFGPNRRHFCHAFLSSCLILPASGNLIINTKQPFTGQISAGFRYKLKVARPVAIVTECGINRSFFRIDQGTGKQYPDSFIHQSQSLSTNGLFGGLFMRIRFGQRGDYLGNYIDLGLSAEASLMNRLVTADVVKPTDAKPYLTNKTTVSGMKNINPFYYKASLRVGFDKISLVTSYRFSRLLNIPSVKDLPGFEFGIEVSPVRY